MYDRGSLRFLLVLGLFGAFIGYIMHNNFSPFIGFSFGGLFGIGVGIIIMWLDEKSIY